MPPFELNGDGVARLAMAAGRGGCERTLLQLFDELGFPSDRGTLERLSVLKATFARLDLELFPSIDTGDFDTTRLVRSKAGPFLSETTVQEYLARDEDQTQEFKSSLLFDHAVAANPGVSPENCRSESVLYTCLRSIAGFLTSGGGLVLVGLGPTRNIVGVDADYQFMKEGVRNQDGWSLFLRDKVASSFVDGNSINDYLRVDPIVVTSKTIVRITVSSRRRLSFMRKGTVSLLYRRQGNRTNEVPYHDIEEFLEWRRDTLKVTTQ